MSDLVNNRLFADRPGVVLALGGGGARGFAHVGVLHELHRLGIPVAGIVGVSAGALAGAGYATGADPAVMAGRVLEFSRHPLATDPLVRFFADHNDDTRATGLVDRVGRMFCQGKVVKSFLLGSSVLGETYFSQVTEFFLPDLEIDRLPIPFACAATDVMTGEAAVFTRGSLRRAVTASCSIPGLAVTVEIEGRHFMDGGVACLVPSGLARSLGARRVVAVNVDRDIVCQDIPGQALESYLRAGEIQAYHLNRLLLGQADLVLEPEVGGVHWADFSQAERVIEGGREAVRGAAREIERLARDNSWWRRLNPFAHHGRQRSNAA